MKIKKSVVLLAALLAVTVLTGCNAEPNDGLTSSSTTSAASTDNGLGKIDKPGISDITTDLELPDHHLTDEKHINSLKTMSKHMNQLTLNMLKNCDDNSTNTALSGFSAYSAISMLDKYASGESKAELTNALGEIDTTALGYFKNTVPIETSTVFMIDDTLKLNTPDISSFVRKDLQADDIVSFVNDLANDMSHGMIPTLIERPFDADAMAVIMDGIYFNGEWENKFDEADTYKAKFYGSNAETETNFMETTAFFDIWKEQSIISLDYANSDLTMDICFDLEGKSASEKFEEYLNFITERDIEPVGTQCQLILPKFEVETDMNILDAYKNVGITHLFDENYSKDLKALADDIFVSDATQKTKIIVDEKGTEASSITTIVINKTTAVGDAPTPLLVEVNKPFIYTIREKSTNIILFAGYVYNL